MRFKRETLARYDLPDILYPLSFGALSAVLNERGELPFADMLYALQQRGAEANADWVALEPALARLAELIAPDDERAVLSAGGEDWWVEIGPVDLSGPIVTIQRRDLLIAAMCRRDDGRLRVATYRPLDAKSASALIAMALWPHAEDGTVCMRPNNWEYALDCSAGIGQFYAFERGQAHVSYWEHGLGVKQDGTPDPQWYAQRELSPRRAAVTAIELGGAYAFSCEG